MRTGLALLAAVLVAAGCALAAIAQPPADDFSVWSAWPLPPDAALTAKAEAACGQGQRLPFVVQDRRTAKSAIVLFGHAGEYALCWSSHGGGGSFASGGSTSDERAAPLTARIIRTPAGGRAVSYAHGIVALPGTRATLGLADGTVVEASVAGGRWVAWWPHDVAALEIVAYGQDGVEFVRIDAPATEQP